MQELIDGPIRRTAQGYEVRVRLDWYRSLPMSCVGVTLAVDGEQVPAEQIRFHVNDRDYTLDEMADLHDEFWFVLDSARLRVTPPESLAPGEHDVAVHMSMRIPYLFDEETGNVLTLYSAPRANLTLS